MRRRAHTNRWLGEVETPDWMANAACIGMTSLFFSKNNCATDQGVIKKQRKTEDEQKACDVCDTCRAKFDCLAYALDNNIKDGVWGGATESERSSMKRNRRRRRAV